jgi:hypothetical protein
MKRYAATYDEQGVVVMVLVDGRGDERQKAEPLDPRRDVVDHSDKFGWGYTGAPADQLALALCIDALNGDVPRALAIYGAWKWLVLARIAHDASAWTKTQELIVAEIIDLESRRASERRSSPLAEAHAAPPAPA